MTLQNQFHLDEEQISRAVVDETDLDSEYRRHLSECRVCLKQVEQFRKELFTLGEHARLSVPPMTKPVSLPVEEPTPAGNNFGWLPSFAVAVAAGLVLFVYFLGIENTSPRITEVASQEEQSREFTLEDEVLMDEIFEMVEYPMSDVIYEITVDNDDNFDEFLQFVVPDDQDDFQS